MTDKITLFTHHSFGRCVKEGYKFLVTQLPLVSRVMLPYFTVSGLVAVVYIMLTVKFNVQMQVEGYIELEQLLIAIALWTVLMLMITLSGARFLLAFRRLAVLETPTSQDIYASRGRQYMQSIRRSLQLMGKMLPYMLPVLLWYMPGVAPGAHITNFISGLEPSYQVVAGIVLIVLSLILIVITAPLFYTVMCAVMKPNTVTERNSPISLSTFNFRTAYRHGFRHKGKTFLLMLWTAFLWAVSSAILLLPGIVSVMAYFSSVEGSVNFGDTSDMSMWAYVLMIVVGTIALTFCFMLMVPMIVTQIYLFGDIYSRENNVGVSREDDENIGKTTERSL